MKKWLCSMLLAGCLAQTCLAQHPDIVNAYAAEGYQMVWCDEFDRNGKPDSAHWGYEEGFMRNREAQWYQHQNAFIDNGLLVIEGRKERRPNPQYTPGSRHWGNNRPTIEYTSASINTRGKHHWQYGRFEMRGRIQIGNGLWPAWWTLGVHGEWPANGEIDIMEYYSGKLLANIATGSGQQYKALWYDTAVAVEKLGGHAWAQQFHVWRMDWDEEAIALYVDGMLLRKTPLDVLYDRGGGPHPFRQPHYMLLNLALGGANGGPLTGTTFPNRFEVDYVRVYQKK